MSIKPYFMLIPLLLMGLSSCSSSPESTDAEVQALTAPLTISQLADSLQYFRKNHLQTDILSRNIPDIDRQQAFDIQLEVLDRELADGAGLIGWKMGGTATADPSSFDPVFGYILDRYLVAQNSVLDSKKFPGGSMLVEGEVGFVLKNDLPQGVNSQEELIAHIDYVIGAVELAQATAIPIGDTPLNLNYVLASGMGQVGAIKGSVKAPAQGFDFENETVKCYIDGQLAAEGVASNIFGNPLNALYELANLLPTQDRYLKAGDLIITGSIYQNPTIQGPAEVRLEFSTLGEITFSAK